MKGTTSLSLHFKKAFNLDTGDTTDLSWTSITRTSSPSLNNKEEESLFHPILIKDKTIKDDVEGITKIGKNPNKNIGLDGFIDKKNITKQPQPQQQQQPLVPKEQVPSKASYMKNIRFNPYKSTKPDLLLNLQRYHKLEEQKLLHLYEDDHQKIPIQAWNPIYSYILDQYIDNSTIYQSILQQSKEHYDMYINQLLNKIDDCENIDIILEEKDKSHEVLLEKTLKQSKLKIKEHEKTIDQQTSTIANITQELEDSRLSNRMYLDQINNFKKELAANKSTIQSLTSSLSRIDEDKCRIELNEAGILAELSAYKKAEIALSAETFHLQNVIDEKSRLQATLIQPMVLEAKEKELTDLKDEYQILFELHRKLLVRYTALKFTIDHSLLSLAVPQSQQYGGRQSARKKRNPQKHSHQHYQQHSDSIVLNNNIEDSSYIAATTTSMIEEEKGSFSPINKPISTNKILSMLSLEADDIAVGGGGGVSTQYEREALVKHVDSVLLEYRAILQLEHYKAILREHSPMDKLLELTEVTRFPTILFESVVDQLELLMLEKARIRDNQIELEKLHLIKLNGENEEIISEEAFFPSLGSLDTVPRYLRFDGELIRNIYITRPKILCLIREIWLAKAKHEGRNVTSAFINTTSDKSKNATTSAAITSSEPTDIDFELYTNKDESTIINLLMKHIKPPTTAATITANTTSSSVAVEEDLNLSDGVSVNIVPPQHYVKLLPTLPSNATLGEFLYCYLRDKAKNEIAAIEIAYNIIHALKKYSNFSECSSFQAILEETLPQDIWYDKMTSIEKLRVAVYKENADRITPEKFIKIIRKVYPNKPEADVIELNKALIEDNGDNKHINPISLLYANHENYDESGSQFATNSIFFELLKSQHTQDCMLQESLLIQAIDNQCMKDAQENQSLLSPTADKHMISGNHTPINPHHSTSGMTPIHNIEIIPSSMLQVSKLREAILIYDMNKTRNELNQLLAKGLNCEVAEMLLIEAKRTTVSVDIFKKKLKMLVTKKSIPSTSNANNNKKNTKRN